MRYLKSITEMFDPMGSWDPRQLYEKPSDSDFDVELGDDIETPPGKCPVCKGGGDEVCTEQHFDDNDCDKCDGTGLFWCRTCDGQGILK